VTTQRDVWDPQHDSLVAFGAGGRYRIDLDLGHQSQLFFAGQWQRVLRNALETYLGDVTRYVVSDEDGRIVARGWRNGEG
tara:strand:+ start:2305 stop:2544 length:240 start_codon:yes stop_codon:yes gene_type:complete